MSRIVASAALAAAFGLAPAAQAAPPPPPGTFVASDANACGVVAITWTASAGAERYRISREGDVIGHVGPSATQFIDFEMPGPGTYVYSIEALNGDGASAAVTDAATLPVAPARVEPYDWFNDVFPSTDDPMLPGTAAFDRQTALLATGHNLTPCITARNRQVVPGKHAYLWSPSAARVDLVFRILPGPGNYVNATQAQTDLRAHPSSSTPIDRVNLTQFWSRYLADNGLYGSYLSVPGDGDAHPVAASGPLVGKRVWSPNVWNSERCEVIEGRFRTTRFGEPGVAILPDDLLTPGTHVEYFFRVDLGGGNTMLLPDTACVVQRYGEGSVDGHRWQQFGVLPDRWKSTSYLHPVYGTTGPGDACMLVLDYDDRNGNERVWVSIADSVGATRPPRWGAHNGWHAQNGASVDAPAGFVYAHGGQPGTTWDFFQVKGGDFHCEGNAGSIGSRLGNYPVDVVPPGPSSEMLYAYYKTLMVLSGDRNERILGPLAGRSQDDVLAISDWMDNGCDNCPGNPNRGLLVFGGGFAESVEREDETFMPFYMGAFIRFPDYADASGFSGESVDLYPTPQFEPSNPNHYEVLSRDWANDVFDPLFGLGSQVSTFYPNHGFLGPYFAGVYHPWNSSEYWITLIEGWNIEHMAGEGMASSRGRLAYFRRALETKFGTICNLVGPVSATIDAPVATRSGNFMHVRNNPLAAGTLSVHFGLASADHVALELYDLNGRRVRTLADEAVGPGEHRVTWDGTDAHGRRLPQGAYYALLRYRAQGFQESQKLIVLR